MLFTTFKFAVFAIIAFIIYWIIPARKRWIALLALGYVYYACFSLKYVAILIATTLFSYASGLLLAKYRNLILLAYISICVLTILSFKFFKLALPVGLSFYLFQTMGYVIDVYRGDIEAERHIGMYGAFVSFFPQISSGPISRAKVLLKQIKTGATFEYERAFRGVILILIGFYKKLVVADTLSVYVNNVFDDIYSYTGGALFIASLFYTLQIYCDFSGYSDIAIGMAKLFGIDLAVNFNSPYCAGSIKNFWARWHISLSTWFRDYVYIPLGGNRCSKLRRDLNLMITFLVSGLWHGIDFTFLTWGGLHGLGQVAENHIKFPDNKVIKALRTIVVFLFVNLCWVFFRADSLKDAIYCIAKMPCGLSSPVSYIKEGIGNVGIPGNVRLAYVVLLILILIVTDILNSDGRLIDIIMKCRPVTRIVICAAILLTVLLFAQKGVAGEFVYIRF